MRTLHLDDVTQDIRRGEEGFDPWCKVRPVLDKMNSRSKDFYVPSRNISIDELMIGMKNRCVYIQYMPNKRHACFGLKKFELCDSNDMLQDRGAKHSVGEVNFWRKGELLFTSFREKKITIKASIFTCNWLQCIDGGDSRKWAWEKKAYEHFSL